MEIRKIHGQDINRALDLAWRVFLKFEAPDYSADGIQEFKRSIDDPAFIDKLDFFAAFENDTMLGMIATRKIDHIAMFFVEENVQGQGIGRQLYNFVCELNTKGFFTANSSPFAKRVYEHFGFIALKDLQEINGIKFYPMRVELSI